MSKWKNTSQGSRYAGISILLGGALFVTATLMHPPATDPWTGHHVISMIPDMLTYWQWDHSLMLAAILLWLGGLSLGEAVAGRSPAAMLASRLFIAAITIWVLVLAMELTVLPVLAKEWGSVQDPGTAALGVGLFAFGIMAGDFAMMLAWIGVSLLGLALLAEGNMKPVLAWIGIAAGVWGAIGIPAALLLPKLSVIIYPVTAGPVFIWTILFGIYMITRRHLQKKTGDL
ncbi:hypothetical protein BBD41_15310 [Paenibacillus ihbetae]|uniref:DUF4386 domain-containing protein n=1 Tax=Paenibacillus ihbetae TaxID=1870820 RepID=A0A1B2E1G3_9BACL|nr:hypothetical protein [Paenibacillus ihbetae]ANY73836.1 hypothetical protein BBD41_15310 [Paenibacillus ihbetae]